MLEGTKMDFGMIMEVDNDLTEFPITEPEDNGGTEQIVDANKTVFTYVECHTIFFFKEIMEQSPEGSHRSRRPRMS